MSLAPGPSRPSPCLAPPLSSVCHPRFSEVPRLPGLTSLPGPSDPSRLTVPHCPAQPSPLSSELIPASGRPLRRPSLGPPSLPACAQSLLCPCPPPPPSPTQLTESWFLGRRQLRAKEPPSQSLARQHLEQRRFQPRPLLLRCHPMFTDTQIRWNPNFKMSPGRPALPLPHPCTCWRWCPWACPLLPALGGDPLPPTKLWDHARSLTNRTGTVEGEGGAPSLAVHGGSAPSGRRGRAAWPKEEPASRRPVSGNRAALQPQARLPVPASIREESLRVHAPASCEPPPPRVCATQVLSVLERNLAPWEGQGPEGQVRAPFL